MSDLPRLGFVGLGVMGEPMSGHLVAAGYPLWIYDVSREAAQRVVAGHPSVQIAGTPAELAAEVDIVITMLPDGEVVRSVVFGEHGLMHGLRAGSLVLDTSSSQPWLTTATAAELGERGIDMVDAAVSGAQWGAQAAELVFMVGASSAESLARVTPILDVLGKAWFHLGPLGSGHTMKCINNTITAMTFLATAEGMALGARCGLDGTAMNAVLNASTGQSWCTKNHIEQRVLSRTFDDPFKLSLMLKDIGIATTLARTEQVPMPMSGLGEELYRAASISSGPTASLSELVRWVEHMCGAEIR
jgi:3-hydroxyisobutyrate dehydrogenase